MVLRYHRLNKRAIGTANKSKPTTALPETVSKALEASPSTYKGLDLSNIHYTTPEKLFGAVVLGLSNFAKPPNLIVICQPLEISTLSTTTASKQEVANRPNKDTQCHPTKAP